MNENEIISLFQKYREGKCTPDEAAKIESWFLQYSGIPSDPVILPDYQSAESKSLQKEIWAGISMPLSYKKKNYYPVLRYAAAVIAVLGVSFGYYTTFVKKTKTEITNNIMPGGNKATLTLANGKTISLNTSNGSVATLASGIQITNNTSNGIVSFQIKARKTVGNIHDDNINAVGSNTINTPAGGQYQLILPDGTRVYLNAASTLQFPSTFAGQNQRNVILTGEAYFEVAKNPKQPFLVTTKGQQLTVLGTHFNVSAYPGEAIKTTLAEGSIKLLQPSNNLTQILAPNQQSELLSNGFNVKMVDAEEEIAWKDGLFIFKQTPIEEVLHQLSRWYNVDADYNNLPNARLDAELSRNATLQDLLQVLNFTDKSSLKIELTNERRLKISKK